VTKWGEPPPYNPEPAKSPTAFLRAVEDEARRRRIPLKYLPQLDKGRGLSDGFWLHVVAPPAMPRYEMFQMERNVRTPIFDTYDVTEAERLVLQHADRAARKAEAR
jgi:hypothetical protein